MILTKVYAEAAALWLRDRDLWLRVGGVFFFLPAFAITLFAQFPDFETMSKDSARQEAWLQSLSPWFLGCGIWLLFSTAVILVLALDTKRPAAGTAIVRALRMFPGLLLANLATSLAVSAGTSLFIVPGLYILGRTFLTQPLLVAEPGLGPLGAVVASIQNSHRRGWMFAFVPISAGFATFCAGVVAETFGALAGSGLYAPVHFIFAALDAAALAGGLLAMALLQAAAYRVLGRTSKGI
jgi:hypothetical protein